MAPTAASSRRSLLSAFQRGAKGGAGCDISMDKLGDWISRQKWIKPVESALGAVANTLLVGIVTTIPFAVQFFGEEP